MATMTNPLNLDIDQRIELSSILMHLIDQEIITVDQQERIEDALFGIQMTPEEEAYERRNVSQSDKPKPAPEAHREAK